MKVAAYLNHWVHSSSLHASDCTMLQVQESAQVAKQASSAVQSTSSVGFTYPFTLPRCCEGSSDVLNDSTRSSSISRRTFSMSVFPWVESLATDELPPWTV